MKPGHYVNQLLQVICEHHLDDRDPAMEQIAVMAEAGVLSDGLAQGYLAQIEDAVESQERVPNLLPRAADQEELPAFDLTFGQSIENPGTRLGIQLRDRPRHILVSGGTGMGKSSLGRRLIAAVDHLNRTDEHPIVMIVVCLKGDYADLPNKLGRDRWGYHSIHGSMQLGFNPPRAMNKHVARWIDQVVKILAARCGMKHSAGSLASLMRYASGELSRQARGMSLVPNLSLLCDMVWHDGSKRYFGKNEYRGTVSQVLRDLRDNAGPILDALVGLDVNHYVEQGRSLVIDLTTLAPSLTCILIDLIVSQLLVPRILTRHMVDTTEVLLVIDEADTICSIRANEVYPEGFSPLATYLKQGREFGLMACLSVTHLANVDLMIRANPTYHLYFSQPDPRSLLEASRSLGLEQGGERQLMALAPGQCLYLAAPSELPIPILMQVDHVAPSRDTRPQNHDRHPLLAGKRLREFPALKAVLDRWLPPSKVQTTIQSQNNDAPENTATLEGETRLLPQAQKLLHLAAVHPHYPVARCWDKADKIPIPEIQKQVWQQLQAAKLADFSAMRIGRRNQLLIELTASGWAHVGSKVPHDGGGGKLEHKQPCHWIRMTFEKTGHEVHIEWTVPGTTHRADVAVRRRDGLWDTYEVVATSYENLELHIRNCFEQSNLVARLTIVVAQQQIARQVEKQLHANSSVQPHLDRVNIDVIENYMKGIF